MDQYWQLVDGVLAHPDTPAITVVVLCGVALLVIYALSWEMKVGKKDTRKMTLAQQRRLSREQKEVVEDAFCFAIEEAVFKDKMSRKTARHWYRRLAKEFGLTGLVLRNRVLKKLHPKKAAMLKADIMKRRANGLYKTVLIPDSTESTQPKQKESKNRLEIFLSTRRQHAT